MVAQGELDGPVNLLNPAEKYSMYAEKQTIGSRKVFGTCSLKPDNMQDKSDQHV